MEAIEAFWAWWTSEGRSQLADAIQSGEATDLPDRITALVQAIHPELQWQLAPGTTATHSLTVTPDGDPELRGITELWLRTGPGADETWEYHAARQPSDGPVEAAGLTLDPTQVVFTFDFDDLYEQLDLMLDHESLLEVPREVALEVAFAALEAVIGEDGVERWVGIVDLSDEELDGRPLTDLPEIVSRFAPGLTGLRWEEFETTDVAGWEEHVRINRALKSIDHLGHNIHLEVRIELEAFDRLALPTHEEATLLDGLAASLEQEMGDRALPIAVDTVNRHRSLHYYVNDVETVEELVDEWIGRHDERTIEAMFMVDPAWNNSHRWD